MKTRGFTLVELTITIAVIAILATITAVSYRGTQNNASASAIEVDMKQALQQAAKFRYDNNSYPSSAEDIKALSFRPSRDAYYTSNNYGLCSSGSNFAVISRARGGEWYYQTASGSFESYSGTPGSISSTCSSILGESATYSAWGRTSSGWTTLIE